MSRLVKTPVNQILHTNVAIVKVKIQKMVFEIACYKNKVISWRKGIETDLDEVVQIDTIFTNVSKGEAAKKTDLQKYFGTSDTREVCKRILQDGELQISPKEREIMYESMFKDIVTIITNKCINPDTQRPYPGGVIERALKEQIHFSVKPSKSTKQQALEAIRQLKKKIPIERAHMRLKCVLSGKDNVKKLRQLFKTANKEEEQVKIEKDDYDKEKETASIVCLVDPGLYRDIFELIDNEDGEVIVLDTSVSEEGDTTIDELDNEESSETKAVDDENDNSDHEKDTKKKVEHSDDEEDHRGKKNKKKQDTEDAPSKSKSTKKTKKSKSKKDEDSDDQESSSKKQSVDSDDDEETSHAPTKKNLKKEKKKSKKKGNTEDSDEEDTKPVKHVEAEVSTKKKSAKKGSKKHSDDEFEPKKPTSGKAKQVDSDVSEDEKPSSKHSKKQIDSEEDGEQQVNNTKPKGNNRKSKKAIKQKEQSESEEDEE